MYVHKQLFCYFYLTNGPPARSASVEGAVASWLTRSSPDRAVWIRALAGDIVLYTWACALTVPLSTQVYE